MKNRFNLEQEIMKCWSILDDVELLAEVLMDSPRFSDMKPEHVDKLHNKLSGIHELYELRFNKLWETFEACVKERSI